MKKLICLLVLGMVLAGCAAVGVPLTSNPNTKLAYARSLLNDYGRAIPAERLIQEAIEIYKNKGDDLNLARAYLYYAFLLRHYEIRYWTDKTVTSYNRMKKAIEYYSKAEDIFKKHSRYIDVADVHYYMGEIYLSELKNKINACDNYTESLENFYIFKKNNPDEPYALPEGFKNYEEWIKDVKRRAECP